MDAEASFGLFGFSVSYQIDKNQLNKRRLNLCKKYHPDTNPQKFKEIQSTYEILSNDFARAELILKYHKTPQYTPSQADLCRYLDYSEQGEQTDLHETLYEALNEAFKYEDFGLASRVLVEIKFLQKSQS